MFDESSARPGRSVLIAEATGLAGKGLLGLPCWRPHRSGWCMRWSAAQRWASTHLISREVQRTQLVGQLQ
jgi:hypothetical protein